MGLNGWKDKFALFFIVHLIYYLNEWVYTFQVRCLYKVCIVDWEYQRVMDAQCNNDIL